MNLLAWEFEELVEHMHDRPDIWRPSQSRALTFFRIVEGDPVAVVGAEATEIGAYRGFGLAILAISWSQETADKYLEELARGWTGYGTRCQYAALLSEQAGLDEPTAMQLAVALRAIDANAPPVCDVLPDQLRLPYDVTPPEGNDVPVATYLLRSGGYIALRLVGDRLRLSLSLPSPHGSGYLGETLHGELRPPSTGTTQQLAGYLAGWPSIADAVPESVLSALEQEEDRRSE
jgi:hypothetical protein